MHTATDHPLSSGRAPAEHCLTRDDRGAPRFWLPSVPLEAALNAKVGPKAVAIEATANHGRWIAECPDCHGAQLTAPEDPRFMCVECGNAGVGGLWRPVIWPKNHAAISALLDDRPATHNRNWHPGQTLHDLRAENVEHLGLGD